MKNKILRGYTENDRFNGCNVCETLNKLDGSVYTIDGYVEHLNNDHSVEELIACIVDYSNVYQEKEDN